LEARRRAIRCWIARSARCASRWEAAYFVIAQRRKARRLTPPQHSSSLGLVLATLARLLEASRRAIRY
jgi:hypothetical protein